VTMVLAVVALSVGTYLTRLAGPLLYHRLTLPEAVVRLLPVMAAVPLTALCVTGALTEAGSFAGWARPAGVAVALVLALRRTSFAVIVVAAAGTTALLRLCGVS